MDADPSRTPSGTVVVLVKDFATAKARLAPALDSAGRATLAERLARGVLAAAASIPGRTATVVVGDSPAVVAWAGGLGARGLLQREAGLNAAASEGWAAAAGGDWTMVVHADLADPSGLPDVVEQWRPWLAVLVPDRHGDGTNVMVLPSGVSPEFSYGTGSHARHRVICAALALDVRSLTGTTLSHDVDSPEDLVDDSAGQ
jgi:2-phospho-L-lactate guanylyltransferase